MARQNAWKLAHFAAPEPSQAWLRFPAFNRSDSIHIHKLKTRTFIFVSIRTSAPPSSRKQCYYLLRFSVVCWTYFWQFILQWLAAITLSSNSTMNLYSMFIVLASSSMMNLYNVFLYKFHSSDYSKFELHKW